jgi:DNA-binding PadR family transcriptional regulator
MSALRYAILGLLAREPMSGYDVARRLKVPVGYFWHASHSQIYPELEALRRAGMVTQRTVAGDARPDKKVYTITAAGRGDLEAWVTEPVHPPPLRDELLLKTFSMWTVDRERAEAFYRAQEARFAAELAHFEEIDRNLKTREQRELASAETPESAAYATLRAGIAIKRASAEWCAWMASRFAAPARKRRRRR